MLGDVDPATLDIIAKGRDEAAKAKKGGMPSDDMELNTIGDGKKEINLDTVLHTIDQEIARLKFFQSHPPMGKVADATAALEKLDADRRKGEIGDDVVDREAANKAVDDAKWGVRLVSLALKDNTTFLVTYGEMNTLADFYGSAEEIAQTPAANFRGIVGGVREESIRKFMRLRNELTVKGKAKYDPDAAEHNIVGAIGNKGTLNGAGVKGVALNLDQYGELKLMNEMGGELGPEKRAEIDDRAETSYTAGLARNACHFAPHSWHAWATAHGKGVTLAKQAWDVSQEAAVVRVQIKELQEAEDHPEINRMLALAKAKEAEKLDDEAADLLNAALIENGFGDHFLQDSYAAGHLINKTLIMQWFVTWLDKNWNKRNYTADDDWRQVQQIAYGQKGDVGEGQVAGRDLYKKSTIGGAQSNDPQSVENMSGDWTGRFAALGLQIPSVLRDPTQPEFKVFTWWQEQAMGGKLLTADRGDLQKAKCPVKDDALDEALIKLIDAGVVYYAKYSTGDRAKGAKNIGLGNFAFNKNLSIKREYIPKKEDAESFRGAVERANQGDTAAYEKRAKVVTYADYHKFLNHGYVQLASNVLHDHFCKNGLKVATARAEEPYVIYGDNAMLGKESDKMVKYSAETSHQSRDSIYELAITGQTAYSTEAIADRFPRFARPEGSSVNLRLDEWHGEGGVLKKFCFDTIFDKEVAALFSKSTAIAKDALVGKVSKDSSVHSGEGF